MGTELSDKSALAHRWEEIREEVARGFTYTHHRANANTAKVLEVASFAYAVIELLAEKGVFSIEEVDRRKKAVAGRLEAKFRHLGMGVLRAEPEVDKYAFEGNVAIDCENRVHLCKAACCRLHFALSRQDVEEGIVKWDFARPYLIAHREDGYCAHLDRGSCACTVYEHRPVPCRAYDCRKDKRIWADFERKIPSTELDKLFRKPPGADHVDGVDGGGHRATSDGDRGNVMLQADD